MSRLPQFSEEDSKMLAGSYDFIGMNFYTSDLVWPQESDINDVSYWSDQDIGSTQVRSLIISIFASKYYKF